MSRPHALVLSDVHFAWPRSTAPVISNVGLTISAGDRLLLHGPSGCGKSTLLALMAGVQRTNAGTIAVAGHALPKSESARDRIRGDHIGLVFQQFNLLPFINVLDNVRLPCRFSRRRAERARARHGSVDHAACQLLAHMGLDDKALLRRPANALSVGQQQRVAVARALIGAPELILADEPTSALDSVARDAFLELLFDECAVAEAALVLVSHDDAVRTRFSRRMELGQAASRP
jgi:putative ABC transport system ATP-binding protein